MGDKAETRTGGLIPVSSVTGVVIALAIIGALLLFYIIWVRGGDAGSRLMLPFLPFNSPV